MNLRVKPMKLSLSEKKEKHKRQIVEWKIENADRVRQKNKEYRARTRTQFVKYHKTWISKNRDKWRELKRNYNNLQRRVNVHFKLAYNLRTRLRTALKRTKKTGSAVKDLGCTVLELKKYLESKFLPGMTWENWSRTGWHIDHIKPLSSFDLSNVTELRKACHYTNLQPLWAKDNLRKYNKE